MCDAIGTRVLAYDVALGVTASSERKYCARDINGGELPMGECVSVSVSGTIRENTNDFTKDANSAGSAAELPRVGRSS